MTIKRHIAGGMFPTDPNERREAAGRMAESIYVQFNVTNILVWENPRTGVQHWREDCPSLRRTKLGVSKLVPRTVGMTKPCGMCSEIEAYERRAQAVRRTAAILAIEPPDFLALPAVMGKELVLVPKLLEGGERMATDEVQNAANTLVDSAQKIANNTADLGEEAARTVIGAVIEAVDLLGTALKSLGGHLVKP